MVDFDNYTSKFRIEALNLGFSESNIELCLEYAEKLNTNKVPIIYNLTHLSRLTGLKKNYIIKAAVSSKHSDAYYRKFAIDKKKDGKRIIHEPLPNLKTIQYWILENIFSEIPVSPYAKAYVKKRGLKQNLRFHKEKKKVLNLDIKNFFPSISLEQVENIFKSVGYSDTLTKYLSKLCMLQNSLPQGAPTSPYISNIVMNSFDDLVSKYVRNLNINYSRYADDMTFSGDFDEKHIINFIEETLAKYNFFLNDKKTRLMYNSQRQIVTGVIVNKKIQLSKEKRKRLRLILHYFKLNGIDDFMIKNEKTTTKEKFLNSLIGQVSFGLYLNRTDKCLLELKEIITLELKKIYSGQQ
jgi:RNA-directed DNA polymerase